MTMAPEQNLPKPELPEEEYCTDGTTSIATQVIVLLYKELIHLLQNKRPSNEESDYIRRIMAIIIEENVYIDALNAKVTPDLVSQKNIIRVAPLPENAEPHKALVDRVKTNYKPDEILPVIARLKALLFEIATSDTLLSSGVFNGVSKSPLALLCTRFYQTEVLRLDMSIAANSEARRIELEKLNVQIQKLDGQLSVNQSQIVTLTDGISRRLEETGQNERNMLTILGRLKPTMLLPAPESDRGAASAMASQGFHAAPRPTPLKNITEDLGKFKATFGEARVKILQRTQKVVMQNTEYSKQAKDLQAFILKGMVQAEDVSTAQLLASYPDKNIIDIITGKGNLPDSDASPADQKTRARRIGRMLEAARVIDQYDDESRSQIPLAFDEAILNYMGSIITGTPSMTQS